MSPVPAEDFAQVMSLAADQLDPAHLAEAFRIFNQASEELSSAYTRLQSQVAELTSELAAANGALRQQYQEKAALTERLSLLLAALPAGVMVLDADGIVVDANPAALRLLMPEALSTAPALERQEQPIALQGLAWTQLAAVLQPDQTPGEYALRGTQRRRLTVVETALDSAGGRIILLNDITEAHQLKTQAERNERLAAMGEMAAQLAHQLRTPLAAALLYTANLQAEEINPVLRISIAGKAVARLKHLERLIQDMLLFARGEVLGREAITINSFVDELRQTLEPLARNRGVALEFVVAENLPAVQGNRKALVGALENLLENALQAAANQDARAPLVNFTVTRVDNSLRLQVRDNGAGMPPEVVARLFEPFFTTRMEGTGLGLAIARGVARAHNGSIEVSSTVGVGTEFCVTLPLAVAELGNTGKHDE